jgi:hypothetical protein
MINAQKNQKTQSLKRLNYFTESKKMMKNKRDAQNMVFKLNLCSWSGIARHGVAEQGVVEYGKAMKFGGTINCTKK